MPFICMPTVSSSAGEVKVLITDLFPHKTQSSATLTPNFQGPRYFTALPKSSLVKTVVLDGVNDDFSVEKDVSGLSAYIISTVEVSSDANNISLTPAQADTIATNILTRVEEAKSLSASDINTIIQAVTQDAGDQDGIGKGKSTATVLEILQILSGTRVYTLPADADIADEGANNAFLAQANQASFFSVPAGTKDLSSSDKSFFISATQGQIAKGQSKTKTVNRVVSPDPVLVAYNDDGSLILN